MRLMRNLKNSSLFLFDEIVPIFSVAKGIGIYVETIN